LFSGSLDTSARSASSSSSSTPPFDALRHPYEHGIVTLTVQGKQPRTAGSYPNAMKVGLVRSITGVERVMPQFEQERPHTSGEQPAQLAFWHGPQSAIYTIRLLPLHGSTTVTSFPHAMRT